MHQRGFGEADWQAAGRAVIHHIKSGMQRRWWCWSGWFGCGNESPASCQIHINLNLACAIEYLGQKSACITVGKDIKHLVVSQKCTNLSCGCTTDYSLQSLSTPPQLYSVQRWWNQRGKKYSSQNLPQENCRNHGTAGAPNQRQRRRRRVRGKKILSWWKHLGKVLLSRVFVAVPVCHVASHWRLIKFEI